MLSAQFAEETCGKQAEKNSAVPGFEICVLKTPRHQVQIFISQSTDFISQSTDFHFAKYRFSFRKVQIFISQSTDFHFAKYRFSFRKVQIFISQSTDFHFAKYRFHFVSFRFAKYNKPVCHPLSSIIKVHLTPKIFFR